MGPVENRAVGHRNKHTKGVFITPNSPPFAIRGNNDFSLEYCAGASQNSCSHYVVYVQVTSKLVDFIESVP
ncbi:hypothetical protein SAMD00019534_028340 [Acytostelium subglobosum LB1]|uniref:hypothetical protein n=1 Tax=Acytostelium subglobosum LB1 TaxID=1410327 RepID=UPI0006449FA7|nr:hypothetical protein SAMD00019534_028340 [Acytostelium subglobosum LB1]GAM19659.1 hypothetical protein SAMD00019534_028340 [Acytostelium subglobosum LB1]|eukprot:XP_012756421.1 hypothetical protein SAMD00019534_028340 [Acytostelium subglobosum LB1]